MIKNSLPLISTNATEYKNKNNWHKIRYTEQQKRTGDTDKSLSLFSLPNWSRGQNDTLKRRQIVMVVTCRRINFWNRNWYSEFYRGENRGCAWTHWHRRKLSEQDTNCTGMETIIEKKWDHMKLKASVQKKHHRWSEKNAYSRGKCLYQLLWDFFCFQNS